MTRNRCFLITCFLFVLSCAHPNPDLRSDVSSASTGGAVEWEAKPRSLGSGSGAQLWVRASESINMLYAAPNQEGQQDLFLATSNDVGDTFSKPIRVNSESGEVRAHGENDPQLKQGKGSEIYAVWEGGQDITFARSVNFEKSFTPPIRVNDDSEKTSHSFLTMEVAPDGTIYVAWLDGRDKKMNITGTSSLYISRSIDKGKSFEKNVKVAGNICPCCRPSLAFGSSGEVFVAWRHVFENDERIVMVASSLDGGATWNAVPVAKKGWKINGCAHSGPALGYVDGKLIVAWLTAEDGKAVLKAARSADDGKTFESLKEINGRVLDSNHPHLTVVGNEVWVVFQGRDPDVGGGWDPQKAWLTRISSAGAAIQPEPLPSTGGGVFYPRIFPGHGGRIYVSWTEMKENGASLILCRGRIRS